MSFEPIANLLYPYFIESNPRQLLQIAKYLYNLGCEDEVRPELYSEQGIQFGAGNAVVPWNNPTDNLLNKVRVGTYFDDSLKQINEFAERFREYGRKKNFLWAFIFLYRINQIEPSNQEVIHYMNLIISKVKLSPINILHNAYAMFKDYGLQDWARVCNDLLNNSVRRSSVEDDETISKEADKVLLTNSNDITALILKGMALFSLARKDTNLMPKMTKYKEAEGYLKKAESLMSSKVDEPAFTSEYLVKIQIVTSTLRSTYEDAIKILKSVKAEDEKRLDNIKKEYHDLDPTTLDDAAREYNDE